MRSGRIVSKPVRTTLFMKSARTAASMRGVVSRISIGCRCVWATSLGFEDSNESLEDGDGDLDGRFVRR